MTFPAVLRQRAAEAIAEADGRHLGLEPLADATYEQMADVVLELVAERMSSADALMTEWQRLAEFLRQRNLILSGLLRGMARRVGEVRRELAVAERVTMKVSQSRDSFMAEAKHFEEKVDHLRNEINRLCAEHLQAAEDWQRNDEQTLAENQRLSREVERLRLLLARGEDGKPNPWFTKPAEFPIEQHEQADREAEHPPTFTETLAAVRDTVTRTIEQYVADNEPDPDVRAAILGKRREDCRVEPVFGGQADEHVIYTTSTPDTSGWRESYARHLRSKKDEGEFDRLLTGEWPEASPLTAGELDEALTLDADTERVQHDGACPGHLVGVTCTSCCKGEHVRGHLCAGCGWWDA